MDGAGGVANPSGLHLHNAPHSAPARRAPAAPSPTQPSPCAMGAGGVEGDWGEVGGQETRRTRFSFRFLRLALAGPPGHDTGLRARLPAHVLAVHALPGHLLRVLNDVLGARSRRRRRRQHRSNVEEGAVDEKNAVARQTQLAVPEPALGADEPTAVYNLLVVTRAVVTGVELQLQGGVGPAQARAVLLDVLLLRLQPLPGAVLLAIV